MNALTPAQKRVLDFIRRFIDRRGHPPTRAEIADGLGFRSPNAAAQHLRLLEKKGALRVHPGLARGLSLNEETPPSGLPLVGEVAAGSPILAAENVERRVAVPEGLFSPRPDYLLRVRGESMIEAGIRPGDLVAVHRRENTREGALTVVRIDDEVTLKVWRRKGNAVLLEPRNAAYESLRFDLRRDRVAVEGLVVGLLRLDLRI